MKWFFLASFVIALMLCGFLLSVIVFALVTRVAGEWATVVIVLIPFLVLFGWASRQMLRAFRKARRDASRRTAP